MLQHVNTVLVGKNCPASYTNADALAVGDVALFDENGAIISTPAGAAAANPENSYETHRIFRLP